MNRVRCPICEVDMPGNRHDYPDYPFCSRRCRIIDLGRWLGEDYRIGGKPLSYPESTSGSVGENDSPAR